MQNPTPPPGAQWTDLVPRPARPRRSGLVTAAAFLMAISGAFGVLVALSLLSAGGSRQLSASAQHLVTVIAGVALAFSALQVIAGILILGQSRVGRILGIVLSAIGVVGAIFALALAPTRGLIGLALNGLVMYALTVHKDAFGRVDE